MKIEKIFNKKKGVHEYVARFQLGGKEFRPKASTRKTLNDTIDEIRAREHRTKFELPVADYSPLVKELFAAHAAKLDKGADRKKISMFARVSTRLLVLFPAGIKIKELKAAHFQKYINVRLEEINPQSEKPILPETVNKELSAASVAIKNARKYFAELEDYTAPEIPKAEQTKGGRRRERLVEKDTELAVLLEYLRREHKNPDTAAARRRLADDLEIRYQTGLRRIEVARLERKQYRAREAALRDVRRWKTGTVTKFFPLTRRAVEVIESRLTASDSKYIFSDEGRPSEGAYKTLKLVCGKLNIPYGTFAEGGFVPHDLRHNFSTEIIRVTDIETAKNLTGHTGDHILTYLHTDEGRMREAMNRREGFDRTELLTELYKETKDGSIELPAFIERVGFLIKNG